MKAITRLAALALGFAATLATASATELEGWSTDLTKAFETAKKEQKSVLIEFTGSDWCPPCIEMRKNVFSKKEFVEAASKNLVLVELDFPQANKELAEKNEPYWEKYEIEGFPTVILTDAEGKEFSRFFASEYPEIEKFIAHINKQLANKDLD